MNDISAKLKSIESRISRSKVDIKVFDAEIDVALSKKTKELSRLIAATDEMEVLKRSNQKIIISEHAILRYLQNVKGVDIEQLKEEIIDQKTLKNISTLGNGKFPVKNHKIVVKGGIVVTVVAI